MNVKRTERGMPGHFFICAPRCLFRRNTLLEYNGIKIVVSTVGFMRGLHSNKIETIGHGRFYETMAFYAKKDDEYDDADVMRKVRFNSNWWINTPDAEIEANEMHENVVKEITKGLMSGKYVGVKG